jgi:hypothetical protein
MLQQIKDQNIFKKLILPIVGLTIFSIGLLSVLKLVSTNQDIRKQADTYTGQYYLPKLNNASDYIKFPVKYVNLLYSRGNPSFAPYQAVHPDVLYVPEGWNGYQYWLSVSPFPNQKAQYEDPHIFASNDGINWVEPGNNPVVPLVHPRQFEYSDADLVLVDDILYLYYRLNNKHGSSDYSNDSTTLYRIASSDGVHWAHPQATSLTFTPSGTFASPAIIYENNKHILYYVDTLEDKIYRLTSDHGLNWTNQELVIQMPNAWHIDVMKHDDTYIALINEGPDDGSKIYYYTSQNGFNWTKQGPLLTPSKSGWDSTRLYRASAVIQDNKFRLWYSAYKGGLGHTGYTEDNNFELWKLAAPNCQSWQNIVINNCHSFEEYQAHSPVCQTDSLSVSLKIRADQSVEQMRFMNVDFTNWCGDLKADDPNWSQPEEFKSSKNWLLTEGVGPKKVCMMLKNEAGWGEACGAEIHYEQEPPQCDSWSDVYIENCNSFEEYEQNSPLCQNSSNQVTVHVSGSNQPTHMKLYNAPLDVWCSSLSANDSGWSQVLPYKSTYTWTLEPGTGSRKVCVMLKNGAGWGEACGGIIQVK